MIEKIDPTLPGDIDFYYNEERDELCLHFVSDWGFTGREFYEKERDKILYAIHEYKKLEIENYHLSIRIEDLISKTLHDEHFKRQIKDIVEASKRVRSQGKDTTDYPKLLEEVLESLK